MDEFLGRRIEMHGSVHGNSVPIDPKEVRAIQGRERHFREIVDALPAAVYMTDEHGCITHFNPACVAMSGRTPELGTDYWCVTWKLYNPDGTRLPHDQCPMAVTLKTGKPVRGVEAIAERPDGSRVWFEPYPTPLFDDDGKLIGAVNMLVDITERKTAEEKLRFSERRYHQLLDLLPVAVYTCEAPSGRITYFNESAADLWGHKPKLNDSSETFCGSFRLYFPDGTHVPHDQCPMAVALRDGKAFRNVDVRIERRDGSQISAIVNIDPVRDSNGNVVGAVNAFIDVTAIRQAEAALRRSEQDLADFFDNAPVGLHWVGPDGTILRVNDAELDLLGYSRDEYIGRHIAEFHADQDVIDDIICRLNNHETLHGYEARLRCKDGSIRHVLISSNVLWEGDPPQFVRTRCFTRDITDRKQAEAERAQYATKLEEGLAERTRELTEAHEACRRSEAMAILGALSAGIAHDLSNLLLPMRTRIHMLQNSPGLSAEAREHVSAIGQNVQYIGHLGQRVRQYMRDAAKDASPADAEALAEPINLSAWCRQVQPFFQSILTSEREAPIRLECEIGESLPPLLLNKTGLTQAVYNLVQNAAKAMRAAKVGSTIRVRAWTDTDRFVFIAVEDDGPGMTQDFLAHCLEPCAVPKHQAADQQDSGSGMGLPLVKAFCDHSAGEVRVYSPRPLNHGSDRSERGTAVIMRFSVPNNNAPS